MSIFPTNGPPYSKPMKIKPVGMLFLIVIALLLGLTTPLSAAAPIDSGNELVQQDNLDQNPDVEDDSADNAQDQNVASSGSVCLTCIGSIYVSPTASGEAVRILSTGYVLQPLTNACPDCLGIVVGPADLSIPPIVNRLKAAYEAGQPVALTDATVASIRRLHDLLAHQGSAEPVPGGSQVDLVAFRKAQRPDGQFHFLSHLVLPRIPAPDPGPLLTPRDKKRLKRVHNKGMKRKLRKKLTAWRQQRREQAVKQRHALADRNDLQRLSHIFSVTPELPATPGSCGDQENIRCVAQPYSLTTEGSDSYGNGVQLSNTVWAARSFTNRSDFYYVLQETHYQIVPTVTGVYGIPYPLRSWNNEVVSFPGGLLPTVHQEKPQTTMEATQYLASVSKTIGGSVGWNESQGLNASISESTTITNSVTTTVPPINITDKLNLASGVPWWTYDVNELPSQGETIDLFSSWIWEVPFSQYTGYPTVTQTQFQFLSQGVLNARWQFILGTVSTEPITTKIVGALNCAVPLPFGRAFSLQHPVVTSVNPTSVNQGDTFTINGTGFYPSLVDAVLIGGTPLSQDNVTPVSDTQINVVAPAFIACELGCSVVVRTTEGTSNDSVTISIIP
jgi:hypothetical protein